MSSKDLESVGFMGIGFKSFLGFFSKVVVCDKNVRFSTEAPRTGNSSRPDIKKLYYPEWINDSDNLPDGMTTSFEFVEPMPNTLERLEEACDNFNPLWLAVFGCRGLKTLILQERVFEFSNKEEGVEISSTTSGHEKTWRFMILEQAVSLDKTSIRELKERRNRVSDDIQSVQKIVRLLKEIIVIEEEGKKRHVPKEIDMGEMFCLVPLGKDFTFPFKIGIDSDWLVNPTRTALIQEDSAHHYHKSLLSQLPNLLKMYFESLPNDMSSKDRKACLSIFPNIDEEITPALRFLESNQFHRALKETLSDAEFVLCTDGTIRSPSEVRDIPKKPDGMDDEYYRKFTQNCFNCPIVDRTSISDTAINYLREKLGFMELPDNEEIITDQVRVLWDESDDFLHLLDIFDSIISYEKETRFSQKNRIMDEHGPKIIPGSRKNTWLSFRSPNMTFVSLPKSGNGLEKPLFDILTEIYPEMKNVMEIHKKIQDIKPGGKLQFRRTTNNPGSKWRSNAYPLSTKIKQKIKSLDIPVIEENVISVYRYALRIDEASFVKYLHTPGGCKPAERSLIGPPYGDKMMEEIAPDFVISEKIKNASQGYSNERVLEFLKQVGAVSLVPSEKKFPVVKKEDAWKFIDSEPEHATKNEWEPIDWVWPLPFTDCDPIVLGNYLDKINDNEELTASIRKAKRKKRLGYFRHSPKYQTGKNNASWLNDLINYPWVPCADGKFRKPIESKQAAIDEERVGKHAMLSDKSMQYFINTVKIAFGDNIPDDDEARIEYWKSHLARNHLNELRKTLARLQNDGNAESMLGDFLEMKWNTRGAKKSAPFRRFLIDLENDYDGFFGHWSDIDEEVRKFFQVLGYEPKTSITEDLAKEYVSYIASNYVDEIPAEIFSNLKNANSIIIDNNIDFTGCSFFTYGAKWITIDSDKHYYIQLSHDPLLRFEEMKYSILHPSQFPVGIEKLRELYNSSNQFKLIDNQVEIISDMSENNQNAIGILRVVESLELGGLDIFSSTDDGIELNIEGIKTKTHYLIRDEGERTIIYVSSNSKYWAGPVSKFLCEQAGFSGDVVEKVRICLQSEEEEFEEVYYRLCEEGLEQYDSDHVLRNRQQLVEEREPLSPESNDAPRKRRELELEVSESTLTRPSDNSTNHDKNSDRNERRKNASNKRQKSTPRVVSIGDKGVKKSNGEAKSDEATVQMVVDELVRLGWTPLQEGDEMRMDANQEGFDIQAIHPENEILRRVECKGRVSKWGTSNVAISERQMHHALNGNGKSFNGKTIQYMLAVIEESESAPKVRFVPFMEYDLNFIFSRNDWSQDSDFNTDDD